MTRGEMRAAIQLVARDTAARPWSAIHIDRQLNRAAQQVAIKLVADSQISFARATYDSTIGGPSNAITEEPLLGVADLHSVKGMESDSASVPGGRWVSEQEFVSMQERYPDGVDEDDKRVYTVIYHPSATYKATEPSSGTYTFTFDGQTTSPALAIGRTAAQVVTGLEGMNSIGAGGATVTGVDGGPFTIVLGGNATVHLNMTLPTMTMAGTGTVLKFYRYSIKWLTAPKDAYTLFYNALVPDILVGNVNYDNRSYSVVPAQYHHVVLEKALMELLGHTGAPQSGFANALASEQLDRAVNDADIRVDALRRGT